MDSLRQRLRQFGAPLHQQVDEAFSALALETPEGYRNFLLAHADALFSLEQRLEHNGIQRLLADWPARRRSPALRADLQALGCPGGTALPALQQATDSWCWGAVYVLEGSRLGAQVLVRRVQTEQPEAPTRYLSHGNSALLWPSFLQQLEAAAHQCREDQLRQGVEDAFGLFLCGARRQLVRDIRGDCPV